jgi:Na+-transporting NADH:ubiquinone oxidoreductase subunit NqrC
MVAVDIDKDSVEELVVSFSGYGLWYYHLTSGWTRINTVVPDAMIRQGNGLACDYGALYGLWYYDSTGGWQRRNVVDPGQMVAVDIDKDSVEELVVSFSGYGLWYYHLTNGWQRINTVVPVDMKPLNFYP